MSADYEVYRRNQIESGKAYQDLVVDQLSLHLGLHVQVYSSRHYQREVGESRQGIEIKHDQKYCRTGNLWIELAEKARPRPGDYYPSGIRRSDNSWLYAIGDYDTIFVFSKQILHILAAPGRYRHIENITRTSMGYLLPGPHASKYADQILRPKAKQVVAKDVRKMERVGQEIHAQLCWEAKRDVRQGDLFGVPDRQWHDEDEG